MTGMPPAPPSFGPSPEPVAEHTIGGRDLREWRTLAGRGLLAAFVWLVRMVDKITRRWPVTTSVALIFVIGGGLAAWLAESAGDVYQEVRSRSGLAGFDQPVLDWAVSTRTPGRDAVITGFTDIGGPVGGAVLAVVVLLVLVVLWRRWTPVLVMLPALAGALLITIVGKELTGRARPPHSLAVAPFESSASFPSGHALNATVLAGITAYLVLILSRRVWRGVLGAMVAGTYALAMGLSRVWLGHHWLTDVLAGWLLGLAWVLGVVTVHRLVLTLRHRSGSGAVNGTGP
jgi:membrane-associated phospholipid phosphatase